MHGWRKGILTPVPKRLARTCCLNPRLWLAVGFEECGPKWQQSALGRRCVRQPLGCENVVLRKEPRG